MLELAQYENYPYFEVSDTFPLGYIAKKKAIGCLDLEHVEISGYSVVVVTSLFKRPVCQKTAHRDSTRTDKLGRSKATSLSH